MPPKSSRETSIRIQRFLDEALPPFIRDSCVLMWLPMKFLFGKHSSRFMDFKKDAYRMSEAEFADLYRDVAEVSELQGETDLNQRCLDNIPHIVSGNTVLEVGCGRGLLAGKLAESGKRMVTGVDIVVPETIREQYPKVTFAQGNVEDLPFKDKQFDTVVCTHTLEHVRDLPKAMSELRRVAKRRVIVVVPRQRPYTYNFSLHLNYFPYEWSFPALLGYREQSTLRDLGDWLYHEDH